MRGLSAVILLCGILLAGCGKEDSGEANLPKPMSEADIQKLGPQEQENVRRFQEMQKQNSGGSIR